MPRPATPAALAILVRASLFAIAALLSTGAAMGHEFWIAPERYRLAPGVPLRADLMVGNDFSGAAQPYIPSRTARFELHGGEEPITLAPRIGDRPAVDLPASDEGLLIVLHETTDFTLTYDDWEVFARFTDQKDAAWAQARHRARGLPESGFSESYRRFAKALVTTGQGAGQGADRRFGLAHEIVAKANPYHGANTLPVTLYLHGAPRTGAQIEVHARREGTVSRTILRTDAEGRANVPLTPGTEYLLDAVALEERAPQAPGDPVWHSLWASLTFRTD